MLHIARAVQAVATMVIFAFTRRIDVTLFVATDRRSVCPAMDRSNITSMSNIDLSDCRA